MEQCRQLSDHLQEHTLYDCQLQYQHIFRHIQHKLAFQNTLSLTMHCTCLQQSNRYLFRTQLGHHTHFQLIITLLPIMECMMFLMILDEGLLRVMDFLLPIYLRGTLMESTKMVT